MEEEGVVLAGRQLGDGSSRPKLVQHRRPSEWVEPAACGEVVQRGFQLPGDEPAEEAFWTEMSPGSRLNLVKEQDPAREAFRIQSLGSFPGLLVNALRPRSTGPFRYGRAGWTGLNRHRFNPANRGKYQRTVFSKPVSKLSSGSHPNSAWIFRESTA